MGLTLRNIFILLFIIPLFLFAQDDNLDNKKKELEKLRAEINKLENELNRTSNLEKENISSLKKIEERNHLIQQLINKLINEEKAKTKEIGFLDKKINIMEEDISELRRLYSAYVIWLYKNKGTPLIKYLLEAETLNQALLRYRYFSIITNNNEENLDELKSKISNLETLKKDLEIQRREKARLKKEKENERVVLVKKKDEKSKLLTRLQQDQRNIRKEIDDKKKAEARIRNLISRLVEGTGGKLNIEEEFDYTGFEKFSVLKGKLIWPVNNGRVIRKFGENTNKKLNTVTLSYGVDIKTKSNTMVRAVAEGVVSVIEWIPGFGSIIIVTHNENFRTVYGHVSDIRVVENNKVYKGDVLGDVSESLEGNILHFEIWRERKNQDPEDWLTRR